MLLRDYLTQNQIQQIEFAAQVDTTPATISRICQGHTVPRRALMAKIIAATGGAVRAEDLLLPPVDGTVEGSERPAGAAEFKDVSLQGQLEPKRCSPPK